MIRVQYGHLLIRSLMFLSSISILRSTDENDKDKQPLIFDPYTLEIYNLKDTTSQAQDSPPLPCAVACHAEEQEEFSFINYVSFSENSLFVQGLSTLQDQYSNPIKCKQDFRLSLVYHDPSIWSPNLIEIGFEVYFEKFKYPDNFKTSELKEFSHYTDAADITKRWKTVLKNHNPYPRDVRISLMKNWGLIWIPKIVTRFIASSWSLVWMKYSILPTIERDKLGVACDSNTVPDELYNSQIPLDDLYRPANQGKIFFDQVRFPPLSKRSPCKRNNECVKKYNLALPYHFLTSSPESVSCSDLTTVPLWYEIPETLLDRMETFFIAISKMVNKELIIISGVHDTFALPTKNTNELKKIYLNSEEDKLPMPKNIYKIVRHKTHDCDEKNDLCWFDMLIVIQNHPLHEQIQQQKICPRDECKDWGWDSVQYSKKNKKEKNKSPFVYCCALTREVAKLIGFPIGKTRNKELDLGCFPEYNESEGRIECKEIKNDKLEEMATTVEELEEIRDSAITKEYSGIRRLIALL